MQTVADHRTKDLLSAIINDNEENGSDGRGNHRVKGTFEKCQSCSMQTSPGSRFRGNMKKNRELEA